MWYYKGKKVISLKDIPKGVHGFVYETTHIPTGKRYVGKKVLFHNRRKRITQKALREWKKPGRKPKYIRKVVESDWKEYYGSHKYIKSLIKEGRQDEFKRSILCYCTTSKQLSYNETKYQFLFGVLESNNYLNENILGKFYSKDVGEYDS